MANARLSNFVLIFVIRKLVWYTVDHIQCSFCPGDSLLDGYQFHRFNVVAQGEGQVHLLQRRLMHHVVLQVEFFRHCLQSVEDLMQLHPVVTNTKAQQFRISLRDLGTNCDR